jgi:hypothetical protein
MRISEKLLHQFISDLVISNCQLITKTAKAEMLDVIERTINHKILKTGIGTSSNIKLEIASGSLQVSDMGYDKLRAILVLLPKEDFAFPVGSLSHDKWLQWNLFFSKFHELKKMLGKSEDFSDTDIDEAHVLCSEVGDDLISLFPGNNATIYMHYILSGHITSFLLRYRYLHFYS